MDLRSLFLLGLCLLAIILQANAGCPSASYVDSYTSLPSAPVFPTTTLPSGQTPTPSNANPLTQNHWSETANLAQYRPPSFTPNANPSQTNCPHLASGLLNWHDPATWGGSVPGNGKDITIPAGKNVLISSCSIDPSFVFGKITVQAGASLIIGDAPINISAKGFAIYGSFLAGSPTCRLRNHVQITLYGSRGAQSLPAAPEVKGIAVYGQIDLHGVQYYPTWTRLAMTANIGDSIIFVQDLVNWQAGQTIFITSTELKDARDWHRNEVRVITAVYKTSLGSNVAAVQLDQPLSYQHFGGSEYQAEVGLYSRNIVVQGDPNNSDPTDTANAICADNQNGGGTPSTFPCANKYLTGFGGHVQVMGAGSIGRFSGVELYRMGQTNQLGRYPLHFHLIGQTSADNHFIKDCSVHQSFFRCYVIHGTHGALISQSTAYDAIGSCFYLSEDGVEENNTVSYNLAAHVHALGSLNNPSITGNWWSQNLPWTNSGSNLLIPADISAAGFYITNMYNDIYGNAASGGWTGFSLPSLPRPIGDFTSVTNLSPKNRPFKSPFRGNSAHSTGFWWGSAPAFYFGGVLKYTDNSFSTLTYTPGRSVDTVHDTCTDTTVGSPSNSAGCWTYEQQLWLRLEDNKAFLANRGIQHWGDRSEIIRFEAHDVVLSMNVFGQVWIDQMLMNCRSSHKPTWFSGCPNAPAITQSPGWGLCDNRDWYFLSNVNGFQWYDVGQDHILTDSTFRNCRNDWDWCIYGDSKGVCAGSSVFTSLTHSDQFVPELMQVTTGITFDNCNNLRGFSTSITDPEGVTVSGRLQNWADNDGSVSGLGVRAMIGSARANEWWKMNNNCVFEYETYSCPMVPNDGAGSLIVHWNPTQEAKIGSTICVNGNWDGTKPCPLIGNVTHFGRTEGLGLALATNAKISGPIIASAGGWFIRFTNGTPKTLTLDNIDVHFTKTLLIAIPYPSGTTFNIFYQSPSWCGTSWAVCSHNFRAAQSVDEVAKGYGDLYFWDNSALTLYLRVVMAPDYFGDPGTDAPWATNPFGGTPLDAFTRHSLTLDLWTNSQIVIQATCSKDPCPTPKTVAVPPAYNLGAGTASSSVSQATTTTASGTTSSSSSSSSTSAASTTRSTTTRATTSSSSMVSVLPSLCALILLIFLHF